MKKVIIILIIIIALLVSAVVGYFVMMNSKKPKIFNIDPGEFFITNVSNSKCLVKADIIIEASNKKTMEYLTKNEVKVRDIVIRTLRGKSYDEIMRADIQSVLESDIIKELSETYQLEGIDHIYFSEFVVQQ